MREHPIPQDVVGYRFHIVGNMTIKQFAEVGFGCIVAFLIYTTNLYDFIKWPLIGISIAIGAAAAFVPFEERPFDHWLVTFFRVMYKPTLFYWRREPKIPDPFLYNPSQNTQTLTETDLSPARRQRIKDYLGSLNQSKLPDQFEISEQARLQEILMAFQNFGTTGTQIRQAHRPNLTVRTHSLKQQAEVVALTTQTTAPVAIVEETTDKQYLQHSLAANKQILDVSQVATSLEVPELETVSVDRSQLQTEEASVLNSQQAPVDERSYTAPVAAPDEVLSSQPASLNANLPFPTKPSQPNKLVGMVLTPNNELIHDAIVEIKDNRGQVARAVRTNALGQFYVSTAMPNGEYTLEINSDQYQFIPVSIALNGKVVDPIELRSL